MAALALVLGCRVESDDPVAIVLGIALVVLAINAVNLFDGLDGLAGSVTLVTALGLTWLATGRDLTAIAPLELAAAVAGFLVLNWHPARVFLGDSGAYVVGLVLAHLIIDASPSGALQMVVTTGTLGVLAIDLVVTLLRRRVSGHPMFTGDRSHIYDQLRDRGWSVPKVAIGMATAQAAIVVIVYGVDRVFGAAWPSLLALTTILAGSVALLSRLGFLRAGQR
jgi:UDP-N-acetylmuramyl pentapeptide phosphotransferase/UDP-N-acetylglucosamine-1-phosphate transferase